MNDDKGGKKISRRDFFKLIGSAGAIMAFGSLIEKGKMFNTMNVNAQPTTLGNSLITIAAITVDNIDMVMEKNTFCRSNASTHQLDAFLYKVLSVTKFGALNWQGRSIFYSPDEGFVGTDFFTYIAEDANGKQEQ